MVFVRLISVTVIWYQEAVEHIIQLVQMEESHYNIQQAELDHILGIGFWFDIPEFDLEAG